MSNAGKVSIAIVPDVSRWHVIVALVVAASLALVGLLAAPGDASAVSCSNEALREQQGSTPLPDCRAYEQVSPTDKLGNSIINNPTNIQASRSGESFNYLGGTGLPGGVGAQEIPDFLATRTADGWSSKGVLPPQNLPNGAQILGWNEDLTHFYAQVSAVEPPPPIALLDRDTGTGQFTELSGHLHGAPFYFDATSSDGSKVFFEVGQPLTPEAQGAVNEYVWDRDTGSISLVGIRPDGSAAADGSLAGPYDWVENLRFSGGASIGLGGYLLRQLHAISEDGSRAFFTEPETGQLYLRQDPAGPSPTTVHLSGSHKTDGTGTGGSDPFGPQPAAFMGATPDGSIALFTSPEELTDDATTGTEDQGNDLYRYDAATGALVDLTPDPGDPHGAEVQGVLGMSDDGSYVYFVANGALAPGAAPGNCSGEAGGRGFSHEGTCNLYAWHEGTTTFVAQMNPNLNKHADQTNWLPFPSAAGFLLVNAKQTARVSADGRVLLFSSTQPLTAYDNQGCESEYPGEHPARCREFYRYEAQTHALTCVSCDPGGAPPTGEASLVLQPNTVVGVGTIPSQFLTRNLSADGDRVFFDSPDRLVPEDTDAAFDAYEWEADGTGTCRGEAQDGGCLFLLTPGASGESLFLDASADGSDAFVLTEAGLVSQDTDSLADIYDARAGGGIAAQNTPQAPPSCAGESSCRGPSAVPPQGAKPSSSSFAGPGNASPTPRCKKGRARRGRHCVQKKHRGKKKKHRHEKNRGRHRSTRGKH